MELSRRKKLPWQLILSTMSLFLLFFVAWRTEFLSVFGCETSPCDEFKRTYCMEEGGDVSFFPGNILITPLEILRAPVSKWSGLYTVTQVQPSAPVSFETRMYFPDTSSGEGRERMNVVFLWANILSIAAIAFGLAKLWFTQKTPRRVIVIAYILFASYQWLFLNFLGVYYSFSEY